MAEAKFMKTTSQRKTSRPKSNTSRVAAAAYVEQTPSTLRTHGTTGRKTMKIKIFINGKPELHGSAFLDFANSSVMAHDAVMKGISGKVFTRIWESTRGTLPTDAVLKAIGVSERTAHRIKTDPNKALDTRTTDGIYRFESVRVLAAEVLGSAEAAHEWLNTEAMGLEFRKPIDLISTSPGAEAVKTLLQRMKYGVYA